MTQFIDSLDLVDIGRSLDIGMLCIRFHLSTREIDFGFSQDPAATFVVVCVGLARRWLQAWGSRTKIGHLGRFGRFQQVYNFESDRNGRVIRPQELGGLAELGRG